MVTKYDKDDSRLEMILAIKPTREGELEAMASSGQKPERQRLKVIQKVENLKESKKKSRSIEGLKIHRLALVVDLESKRKKKHPTKKNLRKETRKKKALMKTPQKSLLNKETQKKKTTLWPNL